MDRKACFFAGDTLSNLTGGKPTWPKVELKQPIVAEISELLNGAASAVVVDYRGLTVEQDTQLRKKLRESEVSYKVYKNTMIRFAVKGTEFEALVPLSGRTHRSGRIQDRCDSSRESSGRFRQDR